MAKKDNLNSLKDGGATLLKGFRAMAGSGVDIGKGATKNSAGIAKVTAGAATGTTGRVLEMIGTAMQRHSRFSLVAAAYIGLKIVQKRRNNPGPDYGDPALGQQMQQILQQFPAPGGQQQQAYPAPQPAHTPQQALPGMGPRNFAPQGGNQPQQASSAMALAAEILNIVPRDQLREVTEQLMRKLGFDKGEPAMGTVPGGIPGEDKSWVQATGAAAPGKAASPQIS